MHGEQEKRAQVEAAWEEHRAQAGVLRRTWLEAHLKAQDGRCAYCRDEIRLSPDGDATLDHCIPQAKGGPDTFANSVAACALCNLAKADLLPDEFALTMLDRRAAIIETREKKARHVEGYPAHLRAMSKAARKRLWSGPE